MTDEEALRIYDWQEIQRVNELIERAWIDMRIAAFELEFLEGG